MKTAILVTSKNLDTKNLTPNIRTIQEYANKIKSDFIVKQSEHGKFEIFNTLKDYDRIIYFSPIILIRKDCPNLFDIIPKEKIGMLKESKFRSSLMKYSSAIHNYDEYKNMKWGGDWYNTDVIVVSKKDRQIFRNPHFLNEENLPLEDEQINLRVLTEKLKVHELHYNFNRMHFMDEKLGIVRHDGYIINYVEAPENMIVPTMIQDLQIWDTNDYKKFSKRNIVISTSGGMGDQICSEPVIRYIRSTVFPEDNVTVVSHWPRLFNHIEGVKVIDYDAYKGQDQATLVLRTNPDDEHTEHHLSHVFFHPTDFSAMSTIKKSVPVMDRTIKLGLDVQDFSDLVDICDINDLRNLVLIHAGKWWPSKTLPTEWWQEIVDKLDEAGYKVGLIGKTIDEKQGFLPVECPENGVDFRDLTSLGSMISLISQAGILITNDSSPIHIGGAFDNWILTFSTAKRADDILPYRKGTQFYKTLSLEKKLLIDDLDMNWLSHEPSSIDKFPENSTWDDYLPTPDEVVEWVRKIKEGQISNYPMMENFKNNS